MAIRFVDVEAETGEGAEPAPPRRAGTARAEPAPFPSDDAPAVEADASPDGEAPLPGLTHAKPEPKARGRKKPLSSGAPDRPKAPDAPSAPLLDGLVPELQAHAKPTPKPRGRKKAFG